MDLAFHTCVKASVPKLDDVIIFVFLILNWRAKKASIYTCSTLNKPRSQFCHLIRTRSVTRHVVPLYQLWCSAAIHSFLFGAYPFLLRSHDSYPCWWETENIQSAHIDQMVVVLFVSCCRRLPPKRGRAIDDLQLWRMLWLGVRRVQLWRWRRRVWRRRVWRWRVWRRRVWLWWLRHYVDRDPWSLFSVAHTTLVLENLK